MMIKKGFNAEELFLSTLTSSEKLAWMIKSNVNLVSHLEVEFPGYVSLADLTLVLTPKKKVLELIGDISKERILNVLRENRPDIYKTLVSFPNGETWLGDQINNFRGRFL